jgi:hypothetical protein
VGFLVVGKHILIEIFYVVFLHLTATEGSLILDRIAILTPLLADFKGLRSFVLSVNQRSLLLFHSLFKLQKFLIRRLALFSLSGSLHIDFHISKVISKFKFFALKFASIHILLFEVLQVLKVEEPLSELDVLHNCMRKAVTDLLHVQKAERFGHFL